MLATMFPYIHISLVQFSLSSVCLFATPWIAAHQASLSITNSWSSLKLTSIELVMPSSHLILCHPLLLLPPIPPSVRVFSNESTLRMRWPKYWSFSFSISPSNEHPGLIPFRMDWLDLLAVQGTLKSLLQQHSSKASVLQCSAFFMVQFSHPYMTTGKTIALTRHGARLKTWPFRSSSHITEREERKTCIEKVVVAIHRAQSSGVIKRCTAYKVSEGPRSLAWCHPQPSVILREIKCVQQNFPFELFAPGVPVTGIQALSQH